MLSRDCDGCSKLKECITRYRRAVPGDKVYCPDGTAHLIDNSSVFPSPGRVCLISAIQ
ncbi:MAG: hypothetical protein NWE93_01055 [Candidatus Bathyarchaeota archaeon]|nr:hypothetical protein [Candidatus Bathyarchaeota archaeon]